MKRVCSVIREFKKIFARKITYIALFLAVATLCVTSIIYTQKSSGSNNIGVYLGEYNNRDELLKNYETELKSFEESKENFREYGLDLQPIYNWHAVYEYLLENYLEQEDVVYYNVTLFESRDSLCILISINFIVIIVMLVLTAFLSMLFFSSDFMEKKHRFLYAGKDRMKILKCKFVSYILTVLGCWFVFSVLSGIFTYAFSDRIPYVIFVNNGDVSCMHIFIVGILESISVLIYLLPFVVIFFCFGVIARNDIVAGVLDIVFFGVVSGVKQISENVIISFIETMPFYTIAMGFSTVKEWLISYGIELLIVAIICFISVNIFKKADLH